VEAGSLLAVRQFRLNLLTGGRAELTLQVNGSQATGDLEIVAHRHPGTVRLARPWSYGPSDGQWDLERLVLTLPDQRETIDLLFLAR